MGCKMGCLKSLDQGEIAQSYVRFRDLNDETRQKSIQDVMIEVDEENRDNIQTFNEEFKRALDVIDESGMDKQLVYDLLESNTKIVSIYISEKYKSKLINQNSEIDCLKKSIEPLQHQLKTCLFFLDKEDFMTEPEESTKYDDVQYETVDDETYVRQLNEDENLEPQYRNEQILGEEMDRLFEEKNKIEKEKNELEMQLNTLNKNFSENKTLIEELSLKIENTEQRLKTVVKDLEKTEKEKNTFMDCANYFVKMEPYFRNKLVNKMNVLQRRLESANQYKADITQTLTTLHEKHSAEIQSLNEDIRNKQKDTDELQVRILQLETLLKQNQTLESASATASSPLVFQMNSMESFPIQSDNNGHNLPNFEYMDMSKC